MNRSQIILIVVPFLLIFGYQNCQKSNFNQAATPSSETVSAFDVQKIVLAQESLQHLKFQDSHVVQEAHGSTSISVIKNLVYDFDLASGEFHVQDQDAGSDEKYCLSESLKSDVNQLLAAASICKSGPNKIEDRVCAQVMTPAYAILITNRDEFQLGSASDACGSNAVDLCETSLQLKDWFQNTKVKLSSLACGS